MPKTHKKKKQTSLDSTDDDWRNSKTAVQCLSHLFLSHHLSDVSFSFKNHIGVQLPAHKFVLRMRSSVFEAMFDGQFAEAGDTVLIEDMNPSTMKALLRFMYSDGLSMHQNTVMSYLYAAEKYALTGLVQKCSLFLQSHINSNSVCCIHEQAVVYNMNRLERKCFDYMLENASQFLSSDGFLEVSNATLIKLLNNDRLAEDEVNVFKAAIKWAQSNCKSKKVNPDSPISAKVLEMYCLQSVFPICQ